MKITKLEWFKIGIPRDTPYLGRLGTEDVVTGNDCFIRAGNGSLYSRKDLCLLVRAAAEDGTCGWGECVTVVAPQVAEAVVEQILKPQVIGHDAMDVVQINEDLYNSMHVRGFFGGFMMDAVAAVDIALWDLKARLLGLPLCRLLGGERRARLRAYVSGLPVPTRQERADMAKMWQDRGFDAVKVPVIVDPAHMAGEMESLRKALGPDAKLLVDMHWKFTAPEAVRLIRRMNDFDLYLAEAPCAPEDMDGQAAVTAAVPVSVGIGEELRTTFEYRERFVRRCMNVIQPEMGRMGVTQFWQVCEMARTFHQLVMPHGSIGIGVFLAASLQASAASSSFVCHEYQHSIVDRNLRYLKGDLRCEEGSFTLPGGAGLGVEPDMEALEPYIL